MADKKRKRARMSKGTRRSTRLAAEEAKANSKASGLESNTSEVGQDIIKSRPRPRPRPVTRKPQEEVLIESQTHDPAPENATEPAIEAAADGRRTRRTGTRGRSTTLVSPKEDNSYPPVCTLPNSNGLTPSPASDMPGAVETRGRGRAKTMLSTQNELPTPSNLSSPAMQNDTNTDGAVGTQLFESLHTTGPEPLPEASRTLTRRSPPSSGAPHTPNANDGRRAVTDKQIAMDQISTPVMMAVLQKLQAKGIPLGVALANPALNAVEDKTATTTGAVASSSLPATGNPRPNRTKDHAMAKARDGSSREKVKDGPQRALARPRNVSEDDETNNGQGAADQFSAGELEIPTLPTVRSKRVASTGAQSKRTAVPSMYTRESYGASSVYTEDDIDRSQVEAASEYDEDESDASEDDEQPRGRSRNRKAANKIAYKVKVGRAFQTVTLADDLDHNGLIDAFGRLYNCRNEALKVGYSYSTDAVKALPTVLDTDHEVLNLLRGYKKRTTKEQEKIDNNFQKASKAWEKGGKVGVRPEKAPLDAVFILISRLDTEEEKEPTNSKSSKSRVKKGKTNAQPTENGNEEGPLSSAKALEDIEKANHCDAHNRMHMVMEGGYHYSPERGQKGMWTWSRVHEPDSGVTDKIPPAAVYADMKMKAAAAAAAAAMRGPVTTSSSLRAASKYTKTADLITATAQQTIQQMAPPPNPYWTYPYPGVPGPSAPFPIPAAAPAPSLTVGLVFPLLKPWLEQLDQNAIRNPDNRNISQYIPGLVECCQYLRLNEVSEKTSSQLVESYNTATKNKSLPELTDGVATFILAYVKADAEEHVRNSTR